MPNIFTIHAQHFLIPEISETLKGSFTKFFGTVRQKIFEGKLWYPLLCIKFFDTRNFLIHRSVPQQNFSALWDIKISIENRDMPPLIHNFFSIPEIFWKTEGFLYKAFRFSPVRQKLLDGKSWYPHPLLSIKFFSLPEIFWNTEWFPGEVFSVLWEKKSTKPWSFPLLWLKVFDTRILSKHRSVLLRILSALWDKNVSAEFSDVPFSCIKFCDTRNFLKHRGVPQRNFSVLCDKKLSTEKRDTPAPLWCIKFFDTRNFLIHRSVPQQNFSVLCDKKFPRSLVISASYA